jgi:hypothetical protein
MSLKYDRVEYLIRQIDIADAVEDLKNGKRNAKRNLYKFVYFRRMSKHDYKEIVKRYNKVNIRKKKHEVSLFGVRIKEYIPVLFFFSIIGAIGCIVCEIDPDNLLAMGSAIYLLIAFFMYHYSNTQDLQDKDYKIAELNQEIRKFEVSKECFELDIQLLKNELEKVQAQQEQQ